MRVLLGLDYAVKVTWS